MEIIFYLIFCIIVLLIIYYIIKQPQEPFRGKKWKKKFKKVKKAANTINKKVFKPINEEVFRPINNFVIQPMVREIKPIFISPKKKKKRKPVIDIRPYVYDRDSNIPNSYNDEIFEKTKQYYNVDKLMYEKIVTDDKSYKCMFNNNPKILNNNFVRTIIDPKYDYTYKIDSTNCNNSIDPEKCNKNTNYNLEYEIFNKNPNKYLDYSLNKNKIFLHHGLDNSGNIKTFKHYDKVVFEDVQPIYATKYATCKPDNNGFNKELGFNNNFPCGSIVCEKVNEEEEKNNLYNYENLSNLSKNYHEKIMKFEHEKSIDKVLDSAGFTSWISFLDQTQEENTKLFNEPYPTFRV